MAIAFVAKTTANTSTGTMPAGTVKGNLMVAVLNNGNTGVTASLPGWTQVSSSPKSDATTGQAITVIVLYKVAGASEAGPYSFSVTGAGFTNTTIATYSGTDANNPINVNAGQDFSTASLTWTVPSITPVISGTTWLAIYSGFQSNVFPAGSSGWNLRSDDANGTGVYDQTTALTTSASGTATVTTTGTTGANIGYSLALLPAQSPSYATRNGNAHALASTTSVAVSLTTAVASGSLIVVSVMGNSPSTSPGDLASVTDSASNTYTSAQHASTLNDALWVWYSTTGNALTTSQTVTVNFPSGGVAGYAIAVDTITGAATSTVVDASGVSGTIAASPWASPSITTTNAADLLWTVFTSQGGDPATTASASSNPTSGWTTQANIADAGGDNLLTAYQVVSATGTYHVNGTYTTPADAHAAIIAFKAAGGGTTNTQSGTDALTAADSSTTRAQSATYTEPLTLADSRTQQAAASYSDALIAGDSVALVPIPGISFTDALTVADSQATQVAAQVYSDALTAGDALTLVAQQTPPADALTVGDSLATKVAAFAAGYRAVVLSDNPLAYYPLAETSGTVANDVSGNGNNGTISGSLAFAQVGLLAGLGDPGGTSEGFDGSTARIQLPNALQIQPTLSFEVWASPQNNFGPVGSEGGYLLASDPGVRLLVDASGNLSERVQIAGGWAYGGNAYALALGARYHIVLTLDATNTARIYVNGTLAHTDSNPAGSVTYGTNPLDIGGDFFSTWHAVFNGDLQHVAVYNTALSAARIAAHYQAGTFPADLLTAADAETQVAILAAATDALTAGDSVTLTPGGGVGTLTLSDALTVGDSRGTSVAAASYAEPLTVGETLTSLAQQTFPADALTAGDSVALAPVTGVIATDALTPSDALVFAAVFAPLSDTLTPADALVGLVAAQSFPAEALTAGDTYAAALSATLPADALVPAESFGPSLAGFVAVDSPALLDVLAAQAGYAPQTDALTLGETFSIASVQGVAFLSLTDVIVAGDTVTFTPRSRPAGLARGGAPPVVASGTTAPANVRAVGVPVAKVGAPGTTAPANVRAVGMPLVKVGVPGRGGSTS